MPPAGVRPGRRPEPAAAPDPGSTFRRMVVPVMTSSALAAATLALHIRDPHRAGSWGACAMYATTGLYCPMCGGLRAINDLTNGDLLSALSSNLLVALMAPIAVAALVIWNVDAWSGRQRNPSRRRSDACGAVFLAAIAVFTVGRNLPVGSWLAP